MKMTLSMPRTISSTVRVRKPPHYRPTVLYPYLVPSWMCSPRGPQCLCSKAHSPPAPVRYGAEAIGRLLLGVPVTRPPGVNVSTQFGFLPTVRVESLRNTPVFWLIL